MKVLMGAPGSGKGTVGQALRTRGFVHISTGDLIREYLEENYDPDQLAKNSTGQLVDDTLITGLLARQLDFQNAATESPNIVLDGYPRNEDQLHVLDMMLGRTNQRVTEVLYLEISDDRLIERISGRYSCASCGAVYHKVNNPAPDARCSCGSESFTMRADDTPESLKVRLERFHGQCEPLVNIYAARGILRRINADQPIEKVLSCL